MFKDFAIMFAKRAIVLIASVLTAAAVLAMFVPVANAGSVYQDRVVMLPNSYCPIKLRDGVFVNGNAITSIATEPYYDEYRLYVTVGKDSYVIASSVNNLSISQLHAWANTMSATVAARCGR